MSRRIWESLEGLWSPWVSPLGGKTRDSCPKWVQDLTSNKSVLLPWSNGRNSEPAAIVTHYAHAIAFLHESFIGTISSNILLR